jgi:hypothetical protein
MGIGVNVDANDAIDRLLKWYRRKRRQRVPIEQFFARIARDWKVPPLSIEQKEELVEYLSGQRRILKTTAGKTYVTTAAVV